MRFTGRDLLAAIAMRPALWSSARRRAGDGCSFTAARLHILTIDIQLYEPGTNGYEHRQGGLVLRS